MTADLLAPPLSIHSQDPPGRLSPRAADPLATPAPAHPQCRAGVSQFVNQSALCATLTYDAIRTYEG